MTYQGLTLVVIFLGVTSTEGVHPHKANVIAKTRPRLERFVLESGLDDATELHLERLQEVDPPLADLAAETAQSAPDMMTAEEGGVSQTKSQSQLSEPNAAPQPSADSTSAKTMVQGRVTEDLGNGKYKVTFDDSTSSTAASNVEQPLQKSLLQSKVRAPPTLVKLAPLQSVNSSPKSMAPISSQQDGEIAIVLLPQGWTEAVDHETGKKYYYNKALRKSQWERPLEKRVLVKSSDKGKTSGLASEIQALEAQLKVAQQKNFKLREMKDIVSLQNQEKQDERLTQKIMRERKTIEAVEKKLQQSQAQHSQLQAFREGEECGRMQREHSIVTFKEDLQQLPSAVRSQWKLMKCNLHLMNSAQAKTSNPFTQDEEDLDMQIASDKTSHLHPDKIGKSGLDVQPGGVKLPSEVGSLIDEHAMARLDEKSEALDHRIQEKEDIRTVHDQLNHHIDQLGSNGFDPQVETLKLQQRVFTAGTGNPTTGSKYDDEIAAVEKRLMEYNTKQTVKKVSQALQQTQEKASKTHKKLANAQALQQKEVETRKKKDYENLAWALDDPEDDFLKEQRTEELIARSRSKSSHVIRHPNAAQRGFFL